MIRFIITIILAIIFFSCTKENTADGNKSVKIYGSTFLDQGKKIELGVDNNVYVAGQISFEEDNSDIVLLKLDPSGNLIWQYRYESAFPDETTDLILHDDGNISILGYISDSLEETNMFLAKINSEGNEIWSNVFDSPYNEQGNAFSLNAEGNYVITGAADGQSQFSEAGIYDVFLYFVSATGDSLLRLIVPPGGTTNDIGNDILINSEGQIAIMGQTQLSNAPGLNRDNLFLSIFNNNGALLQTWLYGGNGSDIGKHISTSPDGDYLIVGSSSSGPGGNNDIIALMIDKSNITNILWQKYYGGAENDIVNAAASYGSDYYLAGATRSTGNGLDDAYLLKLNQDGEKIFDKTYGSTSDEVFHFINTQNNLLHMVGYNLLEENSMILLLKTDLEGNLH